MKEEKIERRELEIILKKGSGRLIEKIGGKIQKNRKVFTVMEELRSESVETIEEAIRNDFLLTGYFYEKREFFEGIESCLKIEELKGHLKKTNDKINSICKSEMNLESMVRDGSAFEKNMLYLQTYGIIYAEMRKYQVFTNL